jgi:hypothetical protein
MFDTMMNMKKPTAMPGGVFGEDGDVAVPIAKLDEELTIIGDDDLEAAIVELKQHIDALQTQLLMRIAEYHRRDLGRIRHLLGTTSWMKQALRLTSSAASRMLRSARALRHMPDVAAAAAEGRITPDAVRLLSEARRRHPDEFAEHQVVFADIAQYLTTRNLRVAIEHWEQQVDYPSTIARLKHQREQRRLTMSQTWEGMWRLDAVLDPDTGSVIDAAIRSIVDRETVAAAREGADDKRFPWQRRADALGDIADFWLGQSNEVGTSVGDKPHVTITTTLETLLGLERNIPRIDGLLIDPDTLRRTVCDSTVVRMILDAEGEPLNVSRRMRTIPSAIRRALDQRDEGCIWKGCDAPASWCDAHHLIHWADGGPTSLDNLVLLCRTHHRATHNSDNAMAPNYGAPP